MSLYSEKRIRAAKITLSIAMISLLALSVYEAANYGHEIKWSTDINTGSNDNQMGAFNWVQAKNDTVLASYTTVNGEIVSGLYAFTPDGKVKWSYMGQHGNSISTPLLATNGTIYFVGTLVDTTTTGLIALTASGEEAWTYPVANGTFYPIALGPEGNVYATHAVYDGQNDSEFVFMAFSPQGKLLWEKQFQYSPQFDVGSNGTVLISYDGNITGYGPDGTTLWRTPGSYYSDAVVVDDVLYFTFNNAGNVSGRNGMRADLVAMGVNGSILWQYPDYFADAANQPNMFCLTPVVMDRDGNLLFVRYNGTASEGYASLFAVSPDGQLLWEYRDSSIGVPATQGDRIVVGTSSGLTALDLNGKVLWKLNIHNVNGPPTFGSDGTIYVGTIYVDTSGKLYAIGGNPIVLEVGLIILIPIIAICSWVIWKGKKVPAP